MKLSHGFSVSSCILLAFALPGLGQPVKGAHGHGAGPLIGLCDRQEGVPGRGDVKLISNSWFSIELAARAPVAEWGGQELFVGQEEDAAIDAAGKVSWVLSRHTKYHLVK